MESCVRVVKRVRISDYFTANAVKFIENGLQAKFGRMFGPSFPPSCIF